MNATAATLTTGTSFLSFVDAERATVEVRAVHTFNGLTGLIFRTHRYETEAA